jgi:DNA-binding NtrC family response regulator
MANMNILVIDDNETLREGVAQVIEKMGHAAFKASNGAQGLALFKKHAMDFTITDLKMEGISGMEVLKTIREADPTALVMIITAFGTIEGRGGRDEGGGPLTSSPSPSRPRCCARRSRRPSKSAQTRRENEKLRAVNDALKAELSAPAPQPGGGEAFLGESEPMRRVFGTIQKGRAHRLDGLRLRRVGDGQGGRRQGDPPSQRAGLGAVHQGQLRGLGREPPRVRALWAREGLVHGGAQAQDRAL